MAVPLPDSFGRWAFGISPLHHGHHGRTDVRSGSSDRSGGIASTMSSCLVSGIFVICSNHTKNITTRHARTYHWRRTRRSRRPFQFFDHTGSYFSLPWTAVASGLGLYFKLTEAAQRDAYKKLNSRADASDFSTWYIFVAGGVTSIG